MHVCFLPESPAFTVYLPFICCCGRTCLRLRFQPAVKDDLSQFTRFPPQSCPLSPSPLSLSTPSRPLPVQLPPFPRIQDGLLTYSHLTGTSSCEAFGCRRGGGGVGGEERRAVPSDKENTAVLCVLWKRPGPIWEPLKGGGS